MKKFSWLISKYLLQNVLPYFIFTWLLLSVILFVQQASRYSDIFFSVNIPKNLVWQLTFALIPNVVAFTAPMAILIGVIIGLSKMQGDSELIAIRASGVGNFQITLPILMLGLLLSFFAFFINLKGVPLASNIVRSIALQTALYKLESPIEPGVFNTEVGGYTIYVKTGDKIDGDWKNIFIYHEDRKNNEMRLITAKSGKIDSTIETDREIAELVLQNAVSTTLPLDLRSDIKGKSVSENIGEIRFSIKTRRDDIVKKLTQSQETPEELGLSDLAKLANSAEGSERTEAQILWQRRLLLSVTPLIFALLGTVLVLRFNRGGRGFGILLALISLIGYYLVTLLGEQLARTGKVSVLFAGLLPVFVSLLAIIWFSLSSRLFRRNTFESLKNYIDFGKVRGKVSKSNFYIDLATGIRDFDIILNLLKYFFLTLAFLTSIYLIFTTFEMWKFAGSAPNGLTLLVKYLLYLIPFIYLQLAPSAVMIATLATFVIKSRQNEIVTWTAAGQSVYRLLFPCFLLMIVIGILNWGIQEYAAPRTNQKQDTIRAQIRNKGILTQKEGKYWVANQNRIYSFEKAEKESGSNRKVENLTVYEFSDENQRLSAIFKTPEAIWQSNKIVLTQTEKTILKNQGLETQKLPEFELPDSENPFNNLNQKPSHLNSTETKYQMLEAESETEARNLEIALQKKYTTPFLPFIITLFTAPFALSLSRKGKVLTVGYAVALWLVFMGISSGFEQAGLSGNILPKIAIWTPLFLFSMIGVYLFSKVKT
ncbi:MAG TPA: LptF/LptG family permease [Pyrinomonadaceae bacterium]|nr:LptF/LptG family permease [Pyrinomonadaceae bacterium]